MAMNYPGGRPKKTTSPYLGQTGRAGQIPTTTPAAPQWNQQQQAAPAAQPWNQQQQAAPAAQPWRTSGVWNQPQQAAPAAQPWNQQQQAGSWQLNRLNERFGAWRGANPGKPLSDFAEIMRPSGVSQQPRWEGSAGQSWLEERRNEDEGADALANLLAGGGQQRKQPGLNMRAPQAARGMMLNSSWRDRSGGGNPSGWRDNSGGGTLPFTVGTSPGGGMQGSPSNAAALADYKRWMNDPNKVIDPDNPPQWFIHGADTRHPDPKIGRWLVEQRRKEWKRMYGGGVDLKTPGNRELWGNTGGGGGGGANFDWGNPWETDGGGGGNPWATGVGGGEGGTMGTGEAGPPEREWKDFITKTDTQHAINAAAAQAFTGADPSILAKQYGRPGTSFDAGTLGAIAPQIAQAGVTASTASRAIPLMDLLSNQRMRLGREQLESQYGIGRADLESQMRDMLLSNRMGTLNQLFSLI